MGGYRSLFMPGPDTRASGSPVHSGWWCQTASGAKPADWVGSSLPSCCNSCLALQRETTEEKRESRVLAEVNAIPQHMYPQALRHLLLSEGPTYFQRSPCIFQSTVVTIPCICGVILFLSPLPSHVIHSGIITLVGPLNLAVLIQHLTAM